MKIKELFIRNYKSLVQFEMQDIPNVVVITGGQGTGKSSVLEAIAYFKENLGPYYSTWADPSVVNVNAPFAEITIKFEVYPEEKEYLQKVHNRSLSGSELSGSIRIGKDGRLISPNRPEELYLLLRSYDEHKSSPGVGIFEYLNPLRVMRKKSITTISIGGFSDPEEKRRRIVYAEGKFEMTKDYIAQLAMKDLQKIDFIMKNERRKVGIEDVGDSLEPIKRIFEQLLPPKKLAYVDFSSSPLRIIVSTPHGEIDVDNLSSGEKEILFVFTELLKLDLKNSIILFDEPDLHLNQEVERKIVEQLKSLGSNNQFWIATHSFGIMDSVDYDQLFRLDNYSGSNQITRVFDDQEKYKTFKAVAGDVGIITLGERIVFLEGVEETDKFILDTLFNEYEGKITFVSSGSVSNVMGVSQKILELLGASAKFNFFFAIRDRDFLSEEKRKELVATGNNRLFIWSKYHIENYLLDFDIIYAILRRNFGSNLCLDHKDVFEKMKQVVIENKEKFVSKMVNFALNAETGNIYFRIGFPNVEKQAIDRAEKIAREITSALDQRQVSGLVRNKIREFDEMIANGKWADMLPGRDLLSLFLGKYAHGLAYKQFRNQIVNEMKAQRKIPAEMQGIIDQILGLPSVS